jgi:hypothetical protein
MIRWWRRDELVDSFYVLGGALTVIVEHETFSSML